MTPHLQNTWNYTTYMFSTKTHWLSWHKTSGWIDYYANIMQAVDFRIQSHFAHSGDKLSVDSLRPQSMYSQTSMNTLHIRSTRSGEKIPADKYCCFRHQLSWSTQHRNFAVAHFSLLMLPLVTIENNSIKQAYTMSHYLHLAAGTKNSFFTSRLIFLSLIPTTST